MSVCLKCVELGSVQAEVIEDMVWICDEVGNTMRRYVLLLNRLQFLDPQSRKKILDDLGAQGIRRAKVHEVWDAATILLPRVRDNIPCGSCHRDDYMQLVNNFAEQSMRRLEPVYGRFDGSLRKAEARVCQSLLKQWIKKYDPSVVKKLDSKSLSGKSRASQNEEVKALKGERKKFSKPPSRSKRVASMSSTNSVASVEEAACTICGENFETGSKIYVTSCKHAFHLECLNDWFQQGSVCPICRTDFSQSEDD